MAVETPRKDYTDALSSWTTCRHVYEGERSVKKLGVTYLPLLHPTQLTSSYAAYLTRGLFYNTMARTVAGLTGAVFQTDPEIECPDSVIPHLEDVTLSDLPLTGFGVDLFTELLVTGRYGVLVDMPAKGEAGPQRPRWVAYRAEDIINWRSARVDGVIVPTMVVLKETVEESDPDDSFVTKSVLQYRVLELREGVYTVTIWRKRGGTVDAERFVEGEPIVPQRRGQPLPFIPFCFFGPSSLSPEVEKPPLLDLADVNLSHYRSSTDLEHSRHLIAGAVLVISGVKKTDDKDNPLQYGPAAAILLENPEARAYIVEPSGDGLPSLERALSDKERMMAVLGARLLEDQKRDAEAAETVRMRHAGEHAVLKTMAQTVSLGLGKVLWWHAWWFLGAVELPAADVRVSLNTEFTTVKMTADEVRVQVENVVNKLISYDTFYANLTTGGWTRQGIDAEAELAKIAEEEAAARARDDTRQAAVAKQRAAANPNPPVAEGAAA